MKDQIQQLIAAGQTKDALNLLAQSNGDALLLQAQYNNGEKQFNLGLIEYSEWGRIQARVNFAALEMAGKMGGGSSNASVALSPAAAAVDTPPRPRVFISYNHSDALSMRAVKSHLEDNGIQVFVDIQDMGVGDSIAAFIDRALQENQFILSLISQNSLTSGWVNTEFSSAMLLNRFGKKWLPVLLDQSAFDDKFVRKTQSEIDKKIAGLSKSIQGALAKGRDIRNYTDELGRLTDMKNDFPKNIQAIKSFLSVDVSGPLFDIGMGKVVSTIRSQQ